MYTTVELDEIARKVLQLEIAETALKKEEDPLSKQNLQETQKELAELRERFKAMKVQWENEKEVITSVRRIKEQIEEETANMQKAEREYDYKGNDIFGCVAEDLAYVRTIRE